MPFEFRDQGEVSHAMARISRAIVAEDECQKISHREVIQLVTFPKMEEMSNGPVHCVGAFLLRWYNNNWCGTAFEKCKRIIISFHASIVARNLKSLGNKRESTTAMV